MYWPSVVAGIDKVLWVEKEAGYFSVVNLPLTTPQTFPQKFPRLSHMLFDVRPQMPRSGLPIIRRVADTAGEEDELVSSVRGSTKSFVLLRMNRSTD